MWGAGQRGGECKEIHTKGTVALWTLMGQQEGLVRLAGCSKLGRKEELVQAWEAGAEVLERDKGMDSSGHCTWDARGTSKAGLHC